ncbi:hypothetical protein [Planctomycetes bacterium TBK1r]|uniref:Uncharacterized protein n=1 Tax=Stieleria magnilauensis TaxID=2527963 RepID=A0ABX5XTW3_9BACT|nr:hypothetical protein TBK1r_44820 [Planctomycetes bacterium TBK1r]
MMQKFVDRKSNVWVVDIDSTTLRRVKAIAGVNLLEFVEGDLVERLSHDFLLLGDILYAVCKPQADQQGISDEEFGQGLAGDVISDATAALLEGLVAFFPEPRRRLLQTAAAKYQSVQTKAMELVQMKLNSPDLEEEILDKLRSELDQVTSNGSSTVSPESLESTPDH